GSKVPVILAHIRADYWLARLGNKPDKALTQPQLRLDKVEADLIAPHLSRLEHVRVLFVLSRLDQIDSRRVVRKQRAKGVHYKVQHLLNICRSTDLERDVEQQLELVRNCQCGIRRRSLIEAVVHP